MKVPLSWLSEYASISKTTKVSEIEDAFVRVGFEVEGVDEQGTHIKGPLVVGKVLSIQAVEGQKKPIRYVGLDCGEKQNRFVICGATNFAEGDLVVVALPGAVLPGDFAIAARQTYGHTSDGMICSAKELGISEEHAGIIVLPEGKPGEDALTLLEAKDTIFDIAINPDRGYALSIRGLAREIASSLGVSYKDPAGDIDVKKFALNKEGIQVSLDDPKGANIIYIRTLSGFDSSAKSPMWMRRRIEKCGMRSISLAVDITNYVMLELGQPLHAFDSAKVEGSLHIRRANKEKTFTTLDNVVRNVSDEDLVVADNKKALALAGTMGGLDSEVTEQTTGLAIEAARFEPIAVAKNSRRHKLSTEASRRLERAVDPALAEIASARAADLLIELGGAAHIGSAMDGSLPKPSLITLNPDFISQLLGVKISHDVVALKLEIVGCTVDKKVLGKWLITPPSWRADLLTPADLTEEVARLVGYDHIPSTLPTGKSGATLNPSQARRRSIGLMLADKGYSEVYNYPFVNQEMVDLLGFVGPRAASFKLANPMSDQAPLLRTHLLPGLLDAAKRNLSRGAKDVAIFEIGSVFHDVAKLSTPKSLPISQRPSQSEIESVFATVPAQPLFVVAVVAGQLDRSGWWGKGRKFDWSDATTQAMEIIEATGNIGKIVQSDLAPWHPGRCAEIQVNGKPVAHAGELHPRVLEALGLPARTCAFGVILSELPVQHNVSAPQVITMPAATQDVSLFVGADVAASAVQSALVAGAGELLESIVLFDRFISSDDGKVSLAFTLTFRAPDRTLTAEEVSTYREAAVASAAKSCGAQVRA